VDNPSAREVIWVAARNNDKNALFDLAFALDWGRDGGVPSATFTLVLDALADDEFIGSGAAPPTRELRAASARPVLRTAAGSERAT
jgi:hypothetical protein